jgi:16S rRNA (cytosine1402-N4)-methyltransferase
LAIVHPPVLLEEVVRWLDVKPGAFVLDATVGLGGHAEALLKAMGPQGRLIAMDRDREAIEMAKVRLAQYENRIVWVWGTFEHLSDALRQAGVEALDGVLFDLGVSSLQLKKAERGFSFYREGPLDMRMDPTEHLTAEAIVNRTPLDRLRTILRELGEERWAHRIARAIVASRPIRTTTELAEVVRRAIPPSARHRSKHPATRTFQAIRMTVNRELPQLAAGLEQAIRSLKPSGRVAVVSYHSLEDRMVKDTFRAEAQAGRLEVLTRKPIRPRPSEVLANPQARSARLRVAMRLDGS